MKRMILTNNPYVAEHYQEKTAEDLEVRFLDTSIEGVMLKTRDYIHKGHTLLSHPLSGSVKPHETPYKSVMISASAKASVDLESLEIIEASIACCKKFQMMERPHPEHLADFQLIDFTLIFDSLR